MSTIDTMRAIVMQVRIDTGLTGCDLRKELRKHKPEWASSHHQLKAWQKAVSQVCGKQPRKVGELTDGQKTAVELSNLGNSVREIAQIMHRSDTAVRGYLYGASLRGAGLDKSQAVLPL